MSDKPLRGAALANARYSRPAPTSSPVARLTDQVALPETVRELLHTPGVTFAPDEIRRAVVIVLPIDLAWVLTPLCQDPLQANLACQIVTYANADDQ